MSRVAIIGGLVLMLFSSSAVASVAMLLLGEDDTLKKTTEEAEAAKAAADAEAAAKAAADAEAAAKAAADAAAKAAAPTAPTAPKKVDCGAWGSRDLCEENATDCKWDSYNPGWKCIPITQSLTPTPVTGSCKYPDNSKTRSLEHWAGIELSDIAKQRCGAADKDKCLSSFRIFNDSDVTWNLYNKGYKDQQYNDLCLWTY